MVNNIELIISKIAQLEAKKANEEAAYKANQEAARVQAKKDEEVAREFKKETASKQVLREIKRKEMEEAELAAQAAGDKEKAEKLAAEAKKNLEEARQDRADTAAQEPAMQQRITECNMEKALEIVQEAINKASSQVTSYQVQEETRVEQHQAMKTKKGEEQKKVDRLEENIRQLTTAAEKLKQEAATLSKQEADISADETMSDCSHSPIVHCLIQNAAKTKNNAARQQQRDKIDQEINSKTEALTKTFNEMADTYDQIATHKETQKETVASLALLEQETADAKTAITLLQKELEALGKEQDRIQKSIAEDKAQEEIDIALFIMLRNKKNHNHNHEEEDASTIAYPELPPIDSAHHAEAAYHEEYVLG